MDTLGELYRCFDAEGQLLYIGISNNTMRRLAEHKAKGMAPWRSAVTTVTIERHPVADIKYLERQAILAEKPRHNIHLTTVCEF